MIRIYLLNRQELEHISCSEEIFSEDRKEKIRRLKREEDKQRSACAELLLIYALKKHQGSIELPLPIRCDERRKLCLMDSAWHFNLSHTKDYAVCAISDAPVGVDIESFKVREILYPEKILHPEEARLMAYISNSNEKKKYFYQCWVAKESYLKNLGIGLIVRPSDFMVDEEMLKIGNTGISDRKGNHRPSVPAADLASARSADGAKDTSLQDNLALLEQRYVHVLEPGEVRGTDWKFDAGYKLAVCSMEKDPDLQARLIHAADVQAALES